MNKRSFGLLLLMILLVAGSACSGSSSDSADTLDVPTSGDLSEPDSIVADPGTASSDSDAESDTPTDPLSSTDAAPDTPFEDVAPDVPFFDDTDDTNDDPEAVEDASGDTSTEDTFEVVTPTTDSDGDGLTNLAETTLYGTDPYKADTDGDGVNDGKEVADGTKPKDPSSAKVWRPELTEHPRLFFEAEDIPTLFARTQATEGPHKALYDAIVATANQALPTFGTTFDVHVSADLGHIAEAAAFVGLIAGDQAATNKALDALSMPFPDPRELDYNQHYDLFESHALVAMCTAWDYLAGNPLASEDRLRTARDRLLERIGDYYYIGHQGNYFFMIAFSQNNHAIKYFAGLGMCALALNERSTAARDMSEAMTALDFLLNIYQASESEGGYAEGFNYLQYGAMTFLPFFAAYHRWADGASRPYFGVPGLQNGSPHEGKVALIPDFGNHPTTRAIFLRSLWASMPDGLMPPTDDGRPVGLYGALLDYLFDFDGFLWQWFRPAVGWMSGGATTASLALYDGTPAPEHPGLDDLAGYGREGSAPEAGFAVLRTSWEPDASVLVLQGEHGNVRENAEGHEHRDELSFLLHAYGQLLIIDPGYSDWANRDQIEAPSDHNTILVDGQGAPCGGWWGESGCADGKEDLVEYGVDAHLGDFHQDGSIAWVQVQVSYREVTFVRRVLRLDDRFYVIEDRALDDTGHNYTLLLNGLAGGNVPSSSFTMLSDGARWAGPKAWVEAHVMPFTSTATYGHAIEEHELAANQGSTHEKLTASAHMSSYAGFLTLLVPGPAGEAAPLVETTGNFAGVRAMTWVVGDRRYVVVSNRTNIEQTATFTGPEPDLARTINDGLWVEILDLSGNSLESHFIP